MNSIRESSSGVVAVVLSHELAGEMRECKSDRPRLFSWVLSVLH